MSFEEKIDKYRLIRKVETSDSDEKTENEVHAAIREATDILKAAYKSEKKELVDSFKMEYEDLRQSVVKSLYEDRKITKNELTKIKLELGDITKLANNNKVGKERSNFSRIYNYFGGADVKEIEKSVTNLKKKSINKYSKEDAIGALEYLNSEYTKKYKESGIIGRVFNLKDESISELDDRREVRIFQEELINIILGNEKGFNNEYILSFDDKEGNKLVKISEYEEKLENPSEKLNLETTARYISYLNEKSSNKNDFNKKITERFKGDDGVKRLEKILNMGDSDAKDNAIGILEENGLIEKGNLVLDYFYGLYEKFNNFISSFDNFFDGIIGLSEEEGKKFIDYLKDNNEKLRSDFKKSLLEKFDGIDDKETIVEKLINELFEAKDVGEMYKIIDFYEKENKIKLGKKATSQKVIEQKTNEKRLDYCKAKEEGNEEKMVAAQKDLISYDEQSIINENVTEEETEEIVEKLKAGENFEDIIVEISKKNKKLKKNLEESKEKYKKFREDKNIENNEKTIKEIEKKDNDSKYSFGEEKYVSIGGGKFEMEDPITLKPIVITENIKNMTLEKPEALKNVVNVYNFFKDIKLTSAFDNIENLFTAMSEKNSTLDDDNFMNQGELIKFSNNLIKLINKTTNKNGKEIYHTSNNIDTIKNTLSEYSGANSITNGEKTHNIQGEDRLGSDLRRLGITGKTMFGTKKIRDALYS